MGVRVDRSGTERNRARHRIARVTTIAVVAGACAFAPISATAAFATEGAVPSATEAGVAHEPQALAAAEVVTRTTVAFPVQADRAVYLLGGSHPVSATVIAEPAGEQSLPGPLAGTVAFFDGDRALGSAPLVPSPAPDRATASISTDQWAGGGARQVTAVFTPSEGSGFAASTSPAQVYRVVDTERIVPDIELIGDPTHSIADGELSWTIGNIWFSNFNVGFEREVVSGNVSLPEMSVGTTIPERQAYYWRPFTFSAGTGSTDAEGNRVIAYEGTARLTSGSGNLWDFTDPVVHISASGDGYITAEFSGFYQIGVMQSYGPVRVTIATFNGATVEPDADGSVTAQIALNWEGQARGAGTWAHDHEGSFPNEFVALLNPGVSLFFAESSVATDFSKVPHPITLSFTETQLPVDPEPEPEPEPGTEPGTDPGTEPEGPGSGGEDPGTGAGDSNGTDSGDSAAPSAGLLSATGVQPVIAAALGTAAALLALAGGGLLFWRRGPALRGAAAMGRRDASR